MKIRLPRQAFQEALTATSTLTGGRTTKPIYACIKLSAQGEQLELCSTDGEAALRVAIEAIAIDEPGSVVAPADRLVGIVREMDDVEISLEADERACVIRGQGTEFKIFVMNAADFPPTPGFEGDPDLVIAGNELHRMISLTAYAAARETSRYAINGVLWDKTGKKVFMVATDGRRLARAGGMLKQATDGDFKLIVPSKALTVFERTFQPPKDGGAWQVDVRVMPNQVVLRSGNRLLASALVEGNFPKYEDVIPKDCNKRARLDREEFHRAVRKAALLTTEDSRAVRLAFSKEGLVISSNSPEQGEARLELPVQYEGDPIEIGFNPVFVSDALKMMTHEQLQIELHESFRPGVLCGEDKNEFLYVVMPVSLSS